MQIINKKVKDLIPYAKNAKKHEQKQIDGVAKSIEQFGFVQPVVIDKNNEIVIGHCRVLASKKLGLKEVPCVCVDELTDEQVKALRLADNKLNESEWDFTLIDEELASIVDIDMSELGFDISQFEEKEKEQQDLSGKLTENHELIIECENEEQLEELYNEMQERGLECRISTL